MLKQIKVESSSFLEEAFVSTGFFTLDENAKIVVVDNGDSIDVCGVNFNKPVKLTELISSIMQMSVPDNIQIKDFKFLPKLRKFQFSYEEVALTEKEVSLLVFLYEQPQHRASREEILNSVWNISLDAETNTLDAHIYRLRKKIAQCCDLEVLANDGDFYFLNLK